MYTKIIKYFAAIQSGFGHQPFPHLGVSLQLIGNAIASYFWRLRGAAIHSRIGRGFGLPSLQFHTVTLKAIHCYALTFTACKYIDIIGSHFPNTGRRLEEAAFAYIPAELGLAFPALQSPSNMLEIITVLAWIVEESLLQIANAYLPATGI